MTPPTPSTAPARCVDGALSGGPRLKSDQKPILFFDRFSIPFWLHFGSELGAVWGPVWRQNRPKIHPRCTSKPYLLQKHDFHGTLIKPRKINDF